MVQVIKDYLIVLSKGEAELDNGVIFVIDEQFEDDKGNVQFTLKRRDVNIERTPGNYLIKQLFGVTSFKGKDAVDKPRKCIFKQDNIMVVGANPPRTYIAWADNYDELPKGIKSNKKWAIVLDMIYSADSRMEAEINTMKQAQMSESEMYNLATSSSNKYFEGVTDTLNKLVEAKLESVGIAKPMPSAPSSVPSPLNQ